MSLRLIGLYLCQLITDNKSVVSKMLTTPDGRQLLSEGILQYTHSIISNWVLFIMLMYVAAFQLAEAGSVVEITMLLCSQVI